MLRALQKLFGGDKIERPQLPLRREFELFADYFQFYVCDQRFQTDTATIWNDEMSALMLATGPDLIAVGTARNMDVPVSLEILDAEPVPQLDAWDQVIDCGLAIPSGALILFGCTENPGDAPIIRLEPGSYCARISYAGLGLLSEDGLDGEDNYRVQVWKGQASAIAVLKLRPPELCPR